VNSPARETRAKRNKEPEPTLRHHAPRIAALWGSPSRPQIGCMIAASAPALYFALHVSPLLANSPGFDFLVPGNVLGRAYGVWLAAVMVISAGWEIRFQLRAAKQSESFFHSLLAGVLAIGAAIVVQLHVLSNPLPRDLAMASARYWRCWPSCRRPC